MGPSERFALRWDGFKANAIDAFSNMREESEFLDVTLVADDGEKVGANKVVLAGGSAFFNKILKENPHPHPLIYMKGVGFAHLGYIMDFMYTGEARIFQDDLNQFLDIAQDLKIKGLTLPTPAPRQGQPAAEEPGPSLGMLRPSRRDVTSTCHEQAAPPSTISNPHTVQSSLYQSHVSPEEPPPPLASSLPRSLKSAHRKHEDQVAQKISAPNKGQSATEEYSSSPRITAPHEGRVATEDQASSNADIVDSSQSYNAFPKSMEDRGGTCNVKVEVPVGDANLFNVHYGTNENGETYISDVTKRVDVAVTAPDEGQVATEENRDIFHMEDRGDVGDAANVYCGNVIWNMSDVSKRVAATVHGTGLCMEQENNYQSVSAGKKVLVREENNNSVRDAHIKQANDWYYQLETKPLKKCSVKIKKVNISKYTEVSSKSRISSKNYDHEKNYDKKVGSMRSFDRKYMVDDMNDIKVEDMSSMNEHPTHDLGQENTTHGKPDPISTKMFGMPSQIKRRMTSQTGENMYWYQCDVCHKKFVALGNFKLHYRIHTGEKPFQCSVCFKKFSLYGNLKRHYRIHTGEKPFQCSVCFKKFSQYGDLKVHERFHTGEKPFQCEVCLKEFSQSSDLNKHNRIHTGEKPYQCSVCLKKFSRSGSLKRHKRIHTCEMPY